MEAVVEADLHEPVRRGPRLGDTVDLVDPDPGGLLDEDVRAGFERPSGNPGELVVDRRDDDDVGAERVQLVEGAAGRAAELRGRAAPTTPGRGRGRRRGPRARGPRPFCDR